MRHEKVPDNPTCPLCQRVVLPGDKVIFSHGEIVHIKCRVTSEGIADSVAHLLRRNAGAEYCHSCVARLLHATYEQAAKAVTALRMTKRYVVRTMGMCSVCGNHWMTIKAEPPSVGGGASIRTPVVVCSVGGPRKATGMRVASFAAGRCCHG